MAKKTFVNLGAMIRSKEADEYGQDKYYIKLDDKVEIFVNGKKVDKYFNVERPETKFQRMYAKEVITVDEMEEKINKIPEYVAFELNVALD